LIIAGHTIKKVHPEIDITIRKNGAVAIERLKDKLKYASYERLWSSLDTL